LSAQTLVTMSDVEIRVGKFTLSVCTHCRQNVPMHDRKGIVQGARRLKVKMAGCRELMRSN